MSTAWSSAHELHQVLMIKVTISTFGRHLGGEKRGDS
jgi:hypothetical protein